MGSFEEHKFAVPPIKIFKKFLIIFWVFLVLFYVRIHSLSINTFVLEGPILIRYTPEKCLLSRTFLDDGKKKNYMTAMFVQYSIL